MTTIVIMPGGFHPFHAGHYALYQSAQRTFPDADVYVAATDDVTTRPFPFQVKEKLAQLAGVNKGRFMRVKSPFKAEEITSPYNPAKDVLIFVRSEKDSTKPPQPGGIKKDGSPSYLQPLLGAKKLEPFARHAYMAYLPTVEFGPGMTSATEIRAAWPQLNEKRKTALVMSLYPRTQGNAKLAATVVGLLDAAIGTELNEFAPGSGGGESGRWYTDDQMTDIVGDGWWNDLDVSGNISKQQMIQQAQAWLDDQGYSVQVLNAKLNDDDMDWYIEGNFHNPNFAKKGVAEGGNPVDHEWYRKQQERKAKAAKRQDQQQRQPGVAEDSLNEFAVDGFGDSGDSRSKLLASVGRLLDGGNKVDWQVPGQMGHVTRVQDDGITMKRWKMPRSKMSFFLPMNDDSRDSRYTIKMVAPKHYAVVSAEQGMAENNDYLDE